MELENNGAVSESDLKEIILGVNSGIDVMKYVTEPEDTQVFAYEDNETRELAVKQGFVPVVPPKRNRKNPWEYDKELYKRPNEVERYFRRIKRFRRVFTCYDKLDVLYLGNLTLAMIFDAILM